MPISPMAGRALALFVGLTLVAASGCGPSVGGLSGKVTYKGAAVKGGSVILIPESGGESFSTEIKEDGTYSFERVKGGKYKLCVDTGALRPERSIGGPKAAGGFKNEPPKGVERPADYKMSGGFAAIQAENARRYVEIPAQYADSNTTPLSIEVKGGSQTHDIPLS